MTAAAGRGEDPAPPALRRLVTALSSISGHSKKQSCLSCRGEPQSRYELRRHRAAGRTLSPSGPGVGPSESAWKARQAEWEDATAGLSEDAPGFSAVFRAAVACQSEHRKVSETRIMSTWHAGLGLG